MTKYEDKLAKKLSESSGADRVYKIGPNFYSMWEINQMYTRLAEKHEGFDEKPIRQLPMWEAQVRKYALEYKDAVKYY